MDLDHKARKQALVIMLGDEPSKFMGDDEAVDAEYCCPKCGHEGSADDFKKEEYSEEDSE